MRLGRTVELGWLLLLVVVLGAVHVQTRLSVARAERTYRSGDAFVEVDGVRLHYAEAGEGEQAVVLLHGNPGFLQDYDAVMPLIAGEGLRAIAFDRPGHGFSERPEGTVDVHAQARLVHGALVRLGVVRPVLVAHSWSGALALAYALDYPGEVRGLVLLAPVAYPRQGFGSRLQALSQVPVLGWLAAWTVIPTLAKPQIPPVLAAAFAPDPVPGGYEQAATALWVRPQQFRAGAADMLGLTAALSEMAPGYPSIALPVVVMLGDQDRLVPMALHGLPLAAAIPGARLRIVPGLGHEIPQLRPDLVAEAVGAVLRPAP